MMIVNQTPSSISPRTTPRVRELNSSIAPTTQQVLQIVDALEPAADDELAVARSAWSEYQSTRKRDAALRYAERFKPVSQGLAQFIKSKGGITECAGRVV